MQEGVQVPGPGEGGIPAGADRGGTVRTSPQLPSRRPRREEGTVVTECAEFVLAPVPAHATPASTRSAIPVPGAMNSATKMRCAFSASRSESEKE